MVKKVSVKCRIAAILAIVMLYTGCGKVEDAASNRTDTKTDDIAVEEVERSVNRDVAVESIDTKEEKETYSIDISFQQEVDREWLPQIEEVVHYNYNYLCYDFNEQQKKLYKKSLKERGFQLIRQEEVSNVPYEYYEDGQRRIVIIDTGEPVVISITNIYDDIQREDDVYSLEKVLSLMQEEYNNLLQEEKIDSEIEYYPEVVIKCYIPELYEKTGMQAYKGSTKEGRETGIYLLSDDIAYKIEDDLNNICIADIDGDEKYELLSLYGFGSGIYRIHVNAYKYSNPIYFNGLKEVPHCCYTNCFVPKQGYGLLAFKKITDTEVHLVDMKYNYTDDGNYDIPSVTYGEDYGKIVTDLDSLKLNPENLSDFPYYEWDQYFQRNAEVDKEGQEQIRLSNEVPKLTVKVADTILENSVWKEVWKDETQKPISFHDIMANTTEISRFDCPEGFEFKDEICLSFEDAIQPESIQVQDYLITENGDELYNKAGMIERDVRYGEDGNYYIGLMSHFALYLSSSSNTYMNPSYRGFRVRCQFDDQHICEYVFVLSLEPAWIER